MSNIPPSPSGITVFLTIWSVVAPLVGVFTGAYLTKRWQREHWLMDNKRDEYREVIKALSVALVPILQSGKPEYIVSPEQRDARNVTEYLSYEVLGNRIFIHEELEKINVYDRWVALVKSFDKDKNDNTFTNGFRELRRDIRRVALESVRIN